jgi:phytoene dehydrogenase-like protein
MTQWSRDARVIVVGAGIGGLAFARALVELGCTGVQIVEAEAEVGGKVCSPAFAGRPYDLGALSVFEPYRRTRAFLDAFGLETRRIRGFTVDTRDSRRVRSLEAPADLEWFLRFLDAVPAEFVQHPGWRGVVQAGLHRPTREWLEAHDLLPVPPITLQANQSSGYGFLEDEVPAIYFVRTVALCSGPASVVRGGYQELPRRLAASLQGQVDLRLSTRVEAIERGEAVVLRLAGGETLRGDVLVLTGDAAGYLDVLDADDEERRLYSGLRHFPYTSRLMEAPGLPEAADALTTLAPHQSPAARGHVAFFLRPHADRPLYLTWQYDGAFGPPELERLAERDLEALGADDPSSLIVRRWPRYFPHFDSDAIAAGLPQALEARQGLRNTLLVGGTLSMELVEWAIRHAEWVAAQHFAA